MYERGAFGLPFLFCVAAEKRTAKDHGCGTVFKVWRNPVLLKKMGALSGRRGEGRASIGGKKEKGKKEKTKKFIKNFLRLFGMLIE